MLFSATQAISPILLLTSSQTEKLYDIAMGATEILCNITPPFGSGITHTTPQGLAEDYLLLLSSFRGGNHPFLEKYKAQLRALQIPGSWSQQ